LYKLILENVDGLLYTLALGILGDVDNQLELAFNQLVLTVGVYDV